MNARVPTLPTPHDLSGEVDELESLQQMASIVLERRPDTSGTAHG
jgi:hypothetical protein